MREFAKGDKLPDFFEPIFWSYDFSSIDLQKSKKTVIVNTINYGNWEHWAWIVNYYGKEAVKGVIENIPASEFRKPALKLISVLLGIKEIRYARRSDYIRRNKSS